MTKTRLHPENWTNFKPCEDETGKPEAIRWATRLKYYDPDYGKWHATDGSCTFTACGRPVRIFEVDAFVGFDDKLSKNTPSNIAFNRIKFT